jgi:hypothetical protein
VAARSAGALTTAKAYRLLRAILMTAVEDDKLLSRNPCRIKGADNEHTAERPVLTLAQVFELADLVGRHPTGNVRKLGAGAFSSATKNSTEKPASPR